MFYVLNFKNILLAALLLLGFYAHHTIAFEQNSTDVNIALVLLMTEADKKLSNLDKKPKNLGIDGGEIAIKDNNTTGVFINKRFYLKSHITHKAKDAKTKIRTLIAAGYQHIVVDIPTDLLLSLSDEMRNKNILFYNVGNKDDSLRGEQCRKNIIHLAPSYAMLTDALAQFLVSKNWKKWLLINGQNPNDKKFSKAMKRAGKKFGAVIVKEKEWRFGPDSRRTAQKEVPVFTQGVNYDMLLVADEIGEFGEYLIYQTWQPVLVAGTQGLIPTTWHKTHEKWGSAQLQSRFLKANKRVMRPLDYQVWLAIRGIGEAVIRSNSNQFKPIKTYIFADEFSIAGFKGRKLTLRNWNNQLRQPILLASAHSLVSVSPQRKFLHQHSNLDTLGFAKEVSKCTITKEN